MEDEVEELCECLGCGAEVPEHEMDQDGNCEQCQEEAYLADNAYLLPPRE